MGKLPDVLDFDGEGISRPLRRPRGHLDGFEAFGDPPADLVAGRPRVMAVSTPPGAPQAGWMRLPPTSSMMPLPELAQADAAAGEIEVVFDEAEEIPLLGRESMPSSRSGAERWKKAQRVRLQHWRRSSPGGAASRAPRAALRHPGARRRPCNWPARG